MNKIAQCILGGVTVCAVIALAHAQIPVKAKAIGGSYPSPTYDGRFTFARLSYAEYPDGCVCQVGGPNPAGWAHDYPRGDLNLTNISVDVSTLVAHTDSSAVVQADDPEIMKYPMIYLSEPACWRPSEAEINGIRTYLAKGGSIMVDDFTMCAGQAEGYAESIVVFEEIIHRVLPDARIDLIDPTSVVLNGFYKFDTAEVAKTAMFSEAAHPSVHGVYEKNDPKRRLMVMANYDMCMHRFWIWEAQGISSTGGLGSGFKLGVNELLYGIMH